MSGAAGLVWSVRTDQGSDHSGFGQVCILRLLQGLSPSLHPINKQVGHGNVGRSTRCAGDVGSERRGIQTVRPV